MNFLSISFITFFIIVLIGLYWAPSRHLRHRLLLAASLWFYASWGFVYLPVLVVPMVISYFCGIRIEDSIEPTARRRWLTVGIGLNLLLLTYYKYADFFLENVRLTTGAAFRGVGVVLPLGISFFTFKTVSYIIDVYRQDVQPCRSFWQYATFVCYFPDLIAGPLVRASLFLPQMNRSLRPSWPRTSVGCQMILLGITKKLLIADQMALFVDPVFAGADLYSPLTVWSAVIAYSLQIYCDFSGYSDMAIGISKIIGIDLPENFNMPYLAVSPVDFWRRWHITLSNWLRDYLYYSLPMRREHRWDRFRLLANNLRLHLYDLGSVPLAKLCSRIYYSGQNGRIRSRRRRLVLLPPGSGATDRGGGTCCRSHRGRKCRRCWKCTQDFSAGLGQVALRP
jgi:alginate O-acetyltransferase complex protein AlgI